MASSQSTIDITLRAKDQASKVVKKAGENFKKFQNTAKNVGIAFGAMAAAGTLAIKGWIDAANVQLRVEKQLEAVIESTGQAAGFTAQEIKDMASELQSVTTIGDEAIIAGQNMLLTFTQIGEDVFPQATETLLDMATAMNGGATPSAEMLRQQAIQLGKAINDPVVGMTALTRVGVKFTDQQAETIKSLVEMGDVAGAQKVILNELAVEFGGSARKAAETFEGQMIQVKNTVGDLGEEFGMALMPILQDVMEGIKGVVEWFKELSPETKEMIAQGFLVGTAFMAVVAAASLLISAISPMALIIGGIVAGFILLNAKMLESGVTWEEVGLRLKLIWEQASFWVEFRIDQIILALHRMAGASDEEITKIGKQMDEHLSTKWQSMVDTQRSIEEVHTKSLQTQRENLEDELALQLAATEELTGAAKDVAVANYDAQVIEGKAKFAELRVGTTAEITKMRAMHLKELEIMRLEGSIKIRTLADAWLPEWREIAKGTVSSITVMKNAWSELRGFLKNPIKGTVNIVQNILKKVSTSGGPGPKAQFGGKQQEGRAVLVGEAGPEIFVPGSGGNIVPNYKLQTAGGGGIVVNVLGGTYLSEDAAEDMGDLLIEKLKDNVRI